MEENYRILGIQSDNVDTLSVYSCPESPTTMDMKRRYHKQCASATTTCKYVEYNVEYDLMRNYVKGPIPEWSSSGDSIKYMYDDLVQFSGNVYRCIYSAGCPSYWGWQKLAEPNDGTKLKDKKVYIPDGTEKVFKYNRVWLNLPAFSSEKGKGGVCIIRNHNRNEVDVSNSLNV